MNNNPGLQELELCFRLLNIAPWAAEEMVRKARRGLSKQWHPDRFEHDPDLRDEAEEKLKEINAAFTVIDKAGFPRQKSTASDRGADDNSPPDTNLDTADQWYERGVVASCRLKELLDSLKVENSPELREKASWALRFKIHSFRIATERDRTFIEAWEGLLEACCEEAKLENRQIDEKKVVRIICRILRLNPHHEHMWSWLAGTPFSYADNQNKRPDWYPDNWRGDNVLKLCRSVIKKDPTIAQAWYVLGKCYEYRHRGRYYALEDRLSRNRTSDQKVYGQKAWHALNKALQLKPDYPEAWHSLGHLAILFKDWQTADRAIDAVRDIDILEYDLKVRLSIHRRIARFIKRM